MRNAIAIYSDVADKLNNISTIEKNIVLEGLAGKFHISRMSAFLQNFDLFEKMLQDSQNSMGSASRENEEYMKSLQARINKMKQSFEEMALAMGESFLTEGFIQSLQGLRSIGDGLSGLVKTIGGLPLVFGSATIAITLMSKSFRGLLGQGSLLNGMFLKIGVGATGMGLAIRTALASTGVGIFAVIIGVALDQIIKKMGEARERVEEFERKNRELSDSYNANKTEVSNLVAQYERYSKVIESTDYSLEDLQKFHSIRNQLATLMPELVKGEDQYGNKIIGSSASIKSQIGLMEKQVELQERLDAIKRKEEALKTKDSLENDIKNKEKEIETILKVDTANVTGAKGEIENVYKIFNELNEKIANGEKLSFVDNHRFKKAEEVIKSFEMASIELDSLKVTYQQSIMDMIDSNLTLDENTSKTVKGMISDFSLFVATSKMDSEDINKTFDSTLKSLNSKEFTSVLEGYGQAVEEYQKKIDRGYSVENLEEYKQKVKTSFEEVKNALVNLLPKGTDSKIIDEIAKSLTQSGNVAILASVNFDKLSKSTGMSTEELKNQLAIALDTSGGLESIGNSADEASDSMDTLTTAAEKLSLVSSSQLNSLYELIGMYKVLVNIEGENADQSAELQAITEQLTATYPHLVKNKKLNIVALEQEAKANDILLKATEDLLKGNLTNEQAKTTTTAIQAKRRIDILKQELAAQNKIVQKFNEMSKTLADNANTLEQEKLASKAYDRSKRLTADIDIELPDFNSAIDALATSIDYQGRNAEATKKSNDKLNDSYSNSVYVTDEYKQKLESINLELEKLRAIQAKFPEHSKQYQSALKNEISLMEQKKKLMQDQAAALDKQIKSGKITQTGKVTTTSSSANSSVADYYLSKFRQSSQYGEKSSIRNGRTHAGLDLAAGAGTAIQSLRSGKVIQVLYNNSTGNMIAIQQDDGTVAKYMHMQQKSPLKVGDTVSAGQQVGKVGSTGNSTGNHLHLQVEQGGKTIDPLPYLKGLQNVTSNTSKDIASNLQSIDQAKSELLQLQQDIINFDSEIEALKLKLIDSQLMEFENARAMSQHTLDFENAKQEALSKTGKEYRASVDKQITAMNAQQQANKNELKFLEDLIENGNLSADVMTDMKEKVKALKIEMVALGTAIQEANFEKINSRSTAFDESQDDLQFLVDLTGEYMSLLQEGSPEYKKEAEEQIATMKKQQRMIRTQIDEWKNYLKTMNLAPERVKELNEKIEDLTLRYWSLEGSIKNSTKALEESMKAMQSDAADKLIQSYKDYINERKNAHMKSIDEEIKAENNRHKQITDNLKAELDAYRKIIQAKLDLIDKQESERDYNMEIDKLEEERLGILNKINLLSLDDSFESKAERKKLQEELATIDETIAEKRHDRQIELQKENLNDMLEKKEEEINGREELENQRHENQIATIDREKEYWEKHYEDLLNDERKFAKIRKDIVEGNFEAIKGEFKEYLDYLVKTMPDIADTLDGTMKAVGTSIRQNMIDNLKEALNLLGQVQSNASANASNNNQYQLDKGKPNSPTNGGNSNTGSGNNNSIKGKITVTKPINLWKRKRDSTDMEMVRILKAGETYSVYGYDNKFGGQYDVGADHWITNMPDHIKYAAFEKGGYTGDQEGWSQLHPHEFVLNKGQTKEALQIAGMFDRLKTMFTRIPMPKGIPFVSNQSNQSQPIEINFNVAKMTGNETDVQMFTRKINDSLKRNKGVRR